MTDERGGLVTVLTLAVREDLGGFQDLALERRVKEDLGGMPNLRETVSDMNASASIGLNGNTLADLVRERSMNGERTKEQRTHTISYTRELATGRRRDERPERVEVPRELLLR